MTTSTGSNDKVANLLSDQFVACIGIVLDGREDAYFSSRCVRLSCGND